MKRAWERVTEEVVVTSLLSNKEDGSEDSDIHCLKPGGVAHGAVEELAAQLR